VSKTFSCNLTEVISALLCMVCMVYRPYTVLSTEKFFALIFAGLLSGF